MARDGSGTFTRDGVAASTGATISASNYNTEIVGIASALTASIAKDGQTTPSANLPMGSYKHTGVAAASGASRTEYVSGAVAQDGGVHWCSTAGGTGNAITLTPTPAIAAYAAGQVFRFIASANNTSTVTVAVSGLSAKAVQKATAAMASGDIASGATYEIVYDGTAFQIAEFAIPSDGVTSVVAGSGIGVSGTTTATVSLSISGLTEDTTPDESADFVATYDNSATANKKVKLQNLPGIVRAGAAVTMSYVVNTNSSSTAHGLGAAPSFYSIKLVCSDAGGDGTYSQNDEVHVAGLNSVGGSTVIASIFADATNTQVRITNNSLPQISNKNANTTMTITSGKWNLVVTPWLVA